MRLSDANLALGFGASALGFAVTAIAVRRGWCDRLDRRAIARLAREPAPGKPSRLDTVMRDISSLGSDTVRVIFLVAGTLGLLVTGSYAAAIRFVIVSLGARLAVIVLKQLINRERPPAAWHAVPTYTTSFPSGHTLMATVMLLAAAVLLPIGESLDAKNYALGVAIVLSLAIGVARVYLRVHWPSDVIAGWLGGAAWMTGALLILSQID